MSTNTSNMIEAAIDLAKMGYSVFPCRKNSKAPATTNGFKDATTDIEEIERWDSDLNLAIATGKGLFVLDVDCKPGKADGRETLKELQEQYGPLPITVCVDTPTGGRHYYFRTENEFRISSEMIGPGLDVRADGGYIVAPPSSIDDKFYNYVAELSFDEANLAELPEWLATLASKPKETPDIDSAIGHVGVHKLALEKMNNMAISESEEDGSKRLYACACRCVELDLTDHQAIATVREYTEEHPFPRQWTDNDILRRVRDAEKRIVRGIEIELSNIVEFETGETDQDGNAETATAPLSMHEAKAEVLKATKGWPRRVGSMLFIHDPDHGIKWLDKTEALFGWLRSKRKVRWYSGVELVAKRELQAEFERTAVAYDAVEHAPHYPPMANHYYACQLPPVGNGETLNELIRRFRPSTTIDAQLLKAAFVTTFWGGPPGTRPAFIFTSDAGRGAGKTKTAELIMRCAGGFLDISAGEDIEKLKTRLLSPEAKEKRCCLLDNVKSMKFSWAELEALITTPTVSGRQLYVGEASRPNVLTWFITLNGVSLSTDMAQRSVIIKLDKGKNSGTWYEEMLQFIDSHRDALIGDVAHFMQQMPLPLEKFSRWGSWEKDILSRLPEPNEAQRLILERQGDCDSDQDEAKMFEEHIAEKLSKLDYAPDTAQVRIKNHTMCKWYQEFSNDPKAKTPTVTKRLKQMIDEGQIKRLAVDSSRTYGRGFVYTGPKADVLHENIANDLEDRYSRWP